MGVITRAGAAKDMLRGDCYGKIRGIRWCVEYRHEQRELLSGGGWPEVIDLAHTMRGIDAVV